MTNFQLTLEYDGRDFAGWQRQAGATRTVQGVLEAALERIVGHPVGVVGSGRTDAGVHAEGQVANVRLETLLEPEPLRRALEGVLPGDIAVRDAAVVPEGFHARFDARSKLYRYTIWNGVCRSPLRAARAWQIRRELDLAAMVEASLAFAGTHDFSSFRAAGSPGQDTVRTLARLDVEGRAGAEIQIRIEGDGFLRQMVRVLAGTLVEVGRGRRRPESMAAILAARDRRRAGATAPAHGLTLVRVFYASPGPTSSAGAGSNPFSDAIPRS